ncbi:DUF2625 family protein [Catenulispora subtropica]|uniref:DUF2625 domain-containing protein n=1 Tax=Catenulispora subtropica TaxID=450798 RepID=A0ABN2RZY0_9ACTN
MRELNELTDVADPAWPELLAMVDACPTPVAVAPADLGESRRGLLQLQITARSMLGGIVLNSGGLVFDDGWVRVYGGGSGRDGALPSLAQVNGFPEVADPAWQAPGLVVGHDVLGGVFALNGIDPAAEGKPGEPGQIVYFAPDSLEWEALGVGHSTWIQWLLSGDVEGFYSRLRWDGWREEASAAGFSQGITVFPYLWTKEAHEDLGATTRRAVPMREVLGMAADFARQFGPADPGFLGAV